MQASCKAVAERRQEAAALQSELEPKVDIIVTKTKQLQKQVCIRRVREWVTRRGREHALHFETRRQSHCLIFDI
jgi:hypothetical protein